eukprot:CAMPEP_0178419766 /NCGR_PEP_ID=MMETSP0689_2-20121128/25780_1 /TAXON_ID=160604 /ORGANISM="Amphidinium massartii, Strain CS-259" /LENGTH=240 /DNA_ID=CAMNT_0020041215 /DNA_START=135 /DNA_END=853 /DNA_ORIENTATION=-
MSNFASLSDIRKKEEEDKKDTESYEGGSRSGLAIQNPGDEEKWRRLQQAASSVSGPLPNGAVTVTWYRNGIVVGNGPFRPFSDPLNKKFLDEMVQGKCPEELQGDNPDVHVQLIDKRGEDYKEGAAPAAPAYTAFSGEGNTLGGGSSSSASAAVEADKGSIAVDDSKPKTKLQIRFHNGERKAQEFNQDHTVGDLRAFCMQCVSGQSVAIMGGFPPKELVDDAATLKDAGLCGAQVTIKL